jgi:hypothetical protein
MPEAAMHEYHLPPGWEYKVRGAWQVAAMKRVAKPKPMRQSTHHHLWLGVLASHQRHALRALPLGEGVHLLAPLVYSLNRATQAYYCYFSQ